MNVLWITWKDFRHPEAGGAELVARQLIKRLIGEGHQVTLLTCGYADASREELLEGIRIIRVGNNRYTHSFEALLYYARHLRGQFDVLIEEVNGAAAYFSVFLERRAKKFLFYHQLGRKNWLYEIPKPFSYAGYWLMAPAATRLISLSKAPVITVSESTRQALAGHGFRPEQTHIISEGLDNQPVNDLAPVRKFEQPTLLSFGSMRAMKRTLDHLKAFEIAKKDLPDLQLKLAGGGAGSSYGKAVLAHARQSPYADDIEYLGRISDADKFKLMQRCHAILQTAVEEGWGLTITEAASQGTPAVAYNVDGLRDSIRHQATGILTDPNPTALAAGIVQMLGDTTLYTRLREAGWQWSKQITFDQSYKDFKQAIGLT